MPLYSNQPQQITGQTQQQPEGKRQKGTGFTNIQKLLGANVGAGQMMGSAIGKGITQKAGQLKTDVTSAGQKFQEQYQTEQQKALGPGGSLSDVSDYITGKKDLSSLSSQQAEEIGKRMREAGYGGLGQLENEKALMSRAGNIQALGTLAGMGGIGQGRLLQSVASRRGGYSRGQGLFDQYLLGQDVAGQEAIRKGTAESFGAAQQAQTEANVARQQAQGLGKTIEAQKAEAQQGVLKSLAGAQEQAGQSAKMYLNQAERIKNLLNKEIPVDQMTMEDKLILSDLKKYGLDDTTVYGEDTATIDALLQSIAGAAPLAYTGQQRYMTDAEQKAAENLALISGQADIAKKIAGTKFDEKVFGDTSKSIEGYQTGAQKTTDQLQNEIRAQTAGLNITNAEEAKNALDKFTSGVQAWNQGRRGTEILTGGDKSWLEKAFEVGTSLGQGLRLADMLIGTSPEANFEHFLKNANKFPETTFLKQAADLLGTNRLMEIYRYGDKGKFLGGTTPYRRNFTMDRIREDYDRKLAKINQLHSRYQSKESLQDYINKQFGLPTPPETNVLGSEEQRRNRSVKPASQGS